MGPMKHPQIQYGRFSVRFVGLPSLKLTAKAPENGWLEYKPFLLGFGLFSEVFWLVSGRVFVGIAFKSGYQNEHSVFLNET